MDGRPHLLGMLPEDLAAHLAGRGVNVREGETRRLLSHVISRGAPGYPTARPVPARVAATVEAGTTRARLAVLERVTDPADGFVRYLLASPDGALSEAVCIPLEAPGRFTVCLSSQAGCAMRCAFCATGRLGLTRSLAAWEMVSAFVTVRDEAPGRVTGAVLMGQGEPLANTDAVIQAARVLSHPCGGRIPAEAITISTVGLVSEIHRYAAARHPFRLIVSLTSTVEARRAALLPVAARHPVCEVTEAVRAYQRSAGGRVTVAWVVLGGVNTGADEVAGLARLLAGVPFRLNLIDVNDDRPGGFRRAGAAELAGFRDRLRALGVPVVRRYSGGAGSGAACGTLAARREGEPARARYDRA